MNYFAQIINGQGLEIIPETISLQFPGEAAPRDVPLPERYTPEFIASLVPYDPENPPAPPPPPAPTATQVLAERAARMAQATAEIAPLQDLVDLDEADEADEDDEAKLLEWKQYRAAVSKVQTQPGFPANVEWPVPPAI